jgi:hypothetical protein
MKDDMTKRLDVPVSIYLLASEFRPDATQDVMPAEAGTHDTFQGWRALDESSALTLAWMAACAAMTKLEVRTFALPTSSRRRPGSTTRQRASWKLAWMPAVDAKHGSATTPA